MKIKHATLVLAIMGAAGISSAASSALITYTFSGNFTGTLHGDAFTADAVFTGVGDSATVTDIGGVHFVPLSLMSAVADGETYVISTPTYLGFINNLVGLAPQANPFGSAVNGFSDAMNGYDGAAHATVALETFYVGVAFATNHGSVTLSSARNLSFGAAAVPEPASWAMMVGGFGLIGAAMRRRQRIVVSFA